MTWMPTDWGFDEPAWVDEEMNVHIRDGGDYEDACDSYQASYKAFAGDNGRALLTRLRLRDHKSGHVATMDADRWLIVLDYYPTVPA